MVLPRRPRNRFPHEPDEPLPFQRARQLRGNETASEAKLWSALRRKQIHGVRFRRQMPLGQYFADFACLKAHLVVEVDGLIHIDAEQAAYDARRTRWFEARGFKVIRFWNLDVLTNLDRVIEQIDAEIRARLPSES